MRVLPAKPWLDPRWPTPPVGATLVVWSVASRRETMARRFDPSTLPSSGKLSPEERRARRQQRHEARRKELLEERRGSLRLGFGLLLFPIPCSSWILLRNFGGPVSAQYMPGHGFALLTFAVIAVCEFRAARRARLELSELDARHAADDFELSRRKATP